MRRPRCEWVLIGVGFMVGCGASPDAAGPASAEADVAGWNALAAALAPRQAAFLGPHVQELSAVGTMLYYLDNQALSPRLRRYDDATAATVGYTFSIGDANTYNFRASPSMVVTADVSAGSVTYRAFDASQAEVEIGNTSLAAPQGAKWWAYAVTGQSAFIVKAEMASTVLYEWKPGSAPVKRTTLESAGATIGEFQDFGIDSDTMVFVESGRVWALDLASNKASWLMNQKQADGAVEFASDGVLFDAGSSLMYYQSASKSLVDLAARIEANPWRVNQTFATGAHFVNDFTRYQSWVIYIGMRGVFAYEMQKDTITPIVLEPDVADTRVDYRHPVALGDGSLFVTGLMSSDGAVGAEGPTFKIDLKAILH